MVILFWFDDINPKVVPSQKKKPQYTLRQRYDGEFFSHHFSDDYTVGTFYRRKILNL